MIMFETCTFCEHKPEWHLCPVCKMTGPEIHAARLKSEAADATKEKITKAQQ